MLVNKEVKRIHDAEIERIRAEEAKVDSLLAKAGDPGTSQVERERIAERVADIEGLETRYYMRAGYLLPNCSEPKRSIRSLGAPKDKDVVRYVNMYKSRMGVPVTETPGERECPECQTPMSEEEEVCVRCGTVNYPMETHTTDTVELRSTGVDPFYHKMLNLRSWLDKIQGIEDKEIPLNVKLKVEMQAPKRKWGVRYLDVGEVNTLLKDLKLKEYYDHGVKITQMITGKGPRRLSEQEINNIEDTFKAIQAPYSEVNGGKSNLPGYPYLIYKICELLEYTDMLPYIRMFRTESVIRKHDAVWRKVIQILADEDECEFWRFIQTRLG